MPAMDDWQDDWRIVAEAGELARVGRPCALATVVWRQGPSSGKTGCRALVTDTGELRGWIGGACAEPAVLRAARQVLADGTPRLLLLGTPDQFGATVPDGMTVVPISCQSEGALEVYIEPVEPAPHLVVVGRSPMARTLTELARVLGWRSVLVDVADFDTAETDRHSLVVVATQGHGDEDAVRRALVAQPRYLGLVGSRRRGAAVLGYLADRGLSTGQLDHVQVPAGLDLGHTTHREIAVAILAELVRLRASGALRDASGSTSDGKSIDAPAEAVDPVCGMTVTAGPEAFPREYAGLTYYFCAAGCRREFDRDPAAHQTRETRC
jgi:xanthine dehydrogenase accessory factor